MGTVTIVTGGARGLARELARAGHAVVVVFLRDRRTADTAVCAILADGGAALAIRADVTDALDVERVFDETIHAFGSVHRVVHAAPCSGRLLACELARRPPHPGRRPGDPRVRTVSPERDGPLDRNPMEAGMSASATEATTARTDERTVAMKLEVVVLPVADVDRAKRFYAALGWREDADLATGEDFRVVQLTPPGSPASVIFGTGLTGAAPGSVDSLILVVEDIDAARADLVARGVEASEVFHDAGGVFHHAGTTARVPGPAPRRSSYGSWVSFSDPDGNGWLLQEITERLPGR